jgi:hypothetical protein
VCDNLSINDAPGVPGGTRDIRTRRRRLARALVLAVTSGSLAVAALPALAAAPAVESAPGAAAVAADPFLLQAEAYSSTNGGGLKKETTTDSTGTSIGNVGGTWNGGELYYDAVDFGTSPLSALTVRYVNNSGRVGANPSLDFYLDEKTEATKLGTVALPVTGSNWQTYGTAAIDLARTVSGTHKLIVVMHVTADEGHPFVGNFDWFQFAPAVELPDTFLSTASSWSYSDNNTDPSAGSADQLAWTTAAYDDSAWKTGVGGFGAKNGAATGIGADFPITTLLKHYIDGTAAPTIPTYHFRTEFDVTGAQLAEVESLKGTVTYDDALRVYVNGEKVANFLDDRAGTSNLAYAGTSNGDPVTSTFTIPAEKLRAGENTVAVALFQDRESSSDIYLDVKSLVPVVETGEPGEPTTATTSDLVLGVGATEAERNLTWYTDRDVAQTAQLAKASEVVAGVFPATARSVEPTKTGGTTSGEFFRDVTFDDLEENTAYSYRVGSDVTGWSSTYTFRTQDFDGDFEFLFFGDPQVGASGNLANDEAGWVDTVNRATSTYPDAELLFSAGDQVESAPNEAQYDTFLKPEQVRSIPVVATNGNHDVGSKAYEQHFNVPNEDLTAGAGSATSSGGDYWFIYKDVLFVNINSNSRDYASHNAFMEKVVAEHGDEAKWKVLAFHHSIYSVASHTTDGDIIERRGTMPAQISKAGFDVVLMGHDHNYTRSYLIKDGALADAQELEGQSKVEAKEGEVLYLTANSASGSKYYDTKAPDAWFASVINQEKVRNYSVLEVTDEDLTLRTLRSQANGTASGINSVVDEVVLTKDAAPELTVPGDAEVAYGADFDELDGVEAVDNVDGRLTAEVEVSASVDTTRLGAQTLTYSVSDARGNETTKSRVVTVVEGTLLSAAPVVSGTAKVGRTLTVETGTWTPGTSLSYQWQRNGAAIPGATGPSYAVAPADAGARLTVAVTGTLTGYRDVSHTSSETAAVQNGDLVAGAPAIAGTAKVGEQLTAAACTWTPGAALAYQWRRDGAAIGGATGSSYTLTAADAGTSITVAVTGTLAGYDAATATSVPTAAVAKASLRTAAPKVSGKGKVGSVLRATPGAWTGGTALTFQWLRNGKAIKGAGDARYRIVAADAGKKISVRVSGTLPGYADASRTSAAKKVAKKKPATKKHRK